MLKHLKIQHPKSIKWQLQFTLRPPIPGVRAELQTKQVHAYASGYKLESRVVLRVIEWSSTKHVINDLFYGFFCLLKCVSSYVLSQMLIYLKF